MPESVVTLLHRAPEIALFLALGLGYLVGRVRVRGLTLGATVGTLLVAMLIGVAAPGVPSSEFLWNVFFSLFIYSVGFSTGAQFFHGLNRHMTGQLAVAVAMAVTGLAATLVAARFLHLDAGMAAGLGAGALTQSSIIGTADEAIARLGLPTEETARLRGHVTVAYATTYVLGMFLVILFCRDLVPKLLRFDLRSASRELERRLAGGHVALSEGQFLAYGPRGTRAFRVEAAAGRTVQEVETGIGDRALVMAIRRGAEDVQVSPETSLAAGDIVLISANTVDLLRGGEVIGPEVDGSGIEAVAESVVAVATRRDIVGRTISELRAMASRLGAHRVLVRRLVRGGVETPVSPGVVLHRGDALTLIGAGPAVMATARLLGYAEKSHAGIDLLCLGVGIVAGMLVGMISVPVGGIPVTLGTGGGVLLAGLVFGWLRSVHPTFGRFPSEVQRAFAEIGLNGFVALVGLSAGALAWDTIRDSGLSLVLAGVLITMTPLVCGLVLGLLLRVDKVLLVGVLAGGQASTAGISAVIDRAESSAPALGFTLPYAVSNVLLTIWGPVIVHVVA